MGVFDKASLALVPDGIKDGKLYSIKPTDGSGDFTFTRGSNLAATRVDENGLIEKGRENLAKNTKWEGASLDTAPTNYTGYLLSNGTFNTTSTEGQIRFTTDSSSRAIVITSTISETGIFTQSVYVDEVYTSLPVKDVINRSSSATAIGYYEDGVEITATTEVQAGKRYSIVWNKTGATAFRFGSAVNGQKVGDIVLSRPQIERGLVATELIVSPIGSTGLAGILEDLPRIDYTGGTPSLLLEPSRTNLIGYSESILGVSGAGTIENDFTQVSPTGYKEGVVKISNLQGAIGDRIITNVVAITGGNTYTGSIYIKGTLGETISYQLKRVGGTFAGSLFETITFDGTWQRIESTFTSLSDNTGAIMSIRNESLNTADVAYIWGYQIEEGSYPTSYIPTYGASATRGEDGFEKTGISSLIGQTEGTIFFEFDYSHQFINQPFFNIKEDANNAYQIIALSDFKLRFRTRVSNTSYGDISTPSVVNEGIHKAAMIYKSGGYKFYLDGTLIGTSTDSQIVSNPSEIEYYMDNNNLKQFLVFPEALSDAECITLTT